MNKIILTGNLTRDPELRRTKNGVSVGSCTIAVPREYGASGERMADFLDIVAWEKKGDYLSKYGRKGYRVELTGRLESRKYVDNGGVSRIAWEVVVESLNVFGKTKVENEEEKPEEPKSKNLDSIDIVDDDLPF